MAEIVAAQPGPDGVALTMGTAAGGDTAKVGAHRALLVNNASGAPVTVTLAVPGNTATGEAQPDNVITVADGELRTIPLLPLYADPAINRQVAITWSATTGVTRAVVQL